MADATGRRPATSGARRRRRRAGRIGWADSTLGVLLWGVAIVVAGLTWATSSTAYRGGDFRPVWASGRDFLHHRPVFIASSHPSFQDVITHTIYPPSSLLVAGPFGAVGFKPAEAVMILVALVCVFGTVAIISVGLARPPVTRAGGVVLLLLSFFPPVRAALQLLNLEVVLLPLLALALVLMARNRWLGAGTALGVALAVKPLLAPVVLLFLFARQWRGLLAAVLVPLLLNALLLPLVADPSQFFTAVVPVLLQGGPSFFRSASASIQGVGHDHHVSGALLGVARAVVVIAAVWLAYAAWRRLATPLTRAVGASSVLLLGVFLATGLTYNHYIITLLPVAVVLADDGGRRLRNDPLVAVGVVLSVASFAWVSHYGFSALATAGVRQDPVHALVGYALCAATAVVIVLARPPGWASASEQRSGGPPPGDGASRR